MQQVFFFSVGDAICSRTVDAGETLQMDTRMSGRVIGKFKGVGGSITSLQHDPSGKYLASTSLDRFVRLYEINGKKKLVNKVYLKQRLSCCLFPGIEDEQGAKDAKKELDIDARDDAVWDVLDSRKRVKMKESNETGKPICKKQKT
mmetsp:Transcript_9740/g.23980  ORF Transcript_9740/g.23980 Transcript_9740/m.23980 type:complete len:146 (+) Transcript_9740:789-1226(+)